MRIRRVHLVEYSDYDTHAIESVWGSRKKAEAAAAELWATMQSEHPFEAKYGNPYRVSTRVVM